MAKRASWLLPTAAVAAWIVAGWFFLALPFFERFSANGSLVVVCMKRGMPAPPGVVNEHMTDATITGFPPQLNCNWYTLDGAIVTVQVPFYQPWTYLVAIGGRHGARADVGGAAGLWASVDDGPARKGLLHG